MLMGRERHLYRLRVVVRQRQSEVGDLVRNPRRAGNAKGRNTRPGLHQQAVGVAVIAALEFYHQLAPGKGPRQPDRRHRGLRSRAHKAQLVDRRKRPDHQLGKIGLRRRRSAKARAAPRRFPDSVNHRRKRMAQNHGSP